MGGIEVNRNILIRPGKYSCCIKVFYPAVSPIQFSFHIGQPGSCVHRLSKKEGYNLKLVSAGVVKRAVIDRMTMNLPLSGPAVPGIVGTSPAYCVNCFHKHRLSKLSCQNILFQPF